MKQRLENVMINNERYALTLENGCFASVEKEVNAADAKAVSGDVPSWNASGLVYLPSFTDYHCHLDKTYLGEGWRSRKAFVTLASQLQTERELLATLSSSVVERARLLIDLMLSHGTTRLRTHVDIDPQLGISHLEAIVQVKEEYKDRMQIEIVAFPQHGLLRSQSVSILREAMRNGADLVGLVDPGGLDQQIEASLNAAYELSAEFNVGLDIHLHDYDSLGMRTIDQIVHMTSQTNKQGMVAISHAFCLGQISELESIEAAHRLRDQQIAIISSVPIHRPMPNVPQLTALGVKVHLGTDDILNAWTPFGNGDMLERASRLAERFSLIEDHQLQDAYRYICDASLVPKQGEPANFVLVRALNPEHALAAYMPREFVFSGGKAVAGKLFRTELHNSLT